LILKHVKYTESQHFYAGIKQEEKSLQKVQSQADRLVTVTTVPLTLGSFYVCSTKDIINHK